MNKKKKNSSPEDNATNEAFLKIILIEQLRKQF